MIKTFTMWEGRRGTTGLPAGARAHGARVCTACGGLSPQARDFGCEPLGRRAWTSESSTHGHEVRDHLEQRVVSAAEPQNPRFIKTPKHHRVKAARLVP